MTLGDYPPAALQRGIEGTVFVELSVGLDGAVQGVRVVQSSGSAILDGDALIRAREYRFHPIPAPRAARVPIRYRLI